MQIENGIALKGMFGLGDNIYQYPIVEELASRGHVHLCTPWPQIYNGLSDVSFAMPVTKLRTQSRNVNESKDRYTCVGGLPEYRLTYTPFQRRGLPIYKGLMQSIGVQFPYHLKMAESYGGKGYAVIRPPTIRREWPAPSRNPLALYTQYAIDYLNDLGIITIVLADIQPSEEIWDGPAPERASVYFVNGELDVVSMFSLVHKAALVVGGVGFIVPMCIALGTKAVIVHGGAGGWNAPAIINAPGEGRLTHVLPGNYCLCRSHYHKCNKQIDILRIKKAIDEVL